MMCTFILKNYHLYGNIFNSITHVIHAFIDYITSTIFKNFSIEYKCGASARFL